MTPCAMYYMLDKKEVQDKEADIKEVCRYLGYKKDSTIPEEILKTISKVLEEAGEVLTPRATYLKAPLTVQGDKIEFLGVKIVSHALGINLLGCSKIVLIALTIGEQFDALIRKNAYFGNLKALVLQAVGATYIENFVNLLNNKINEEEKKAGYTTRPRFSPGYADLTLECQRAFFSLLPCNKIGLTLTDSLTMAPEKSVTAFIGCKKTGG